MKNKKIISALLALMITITLTPKREARADVVTAGMVGNAAYAVAQANGIEFAVYNGINTQLTSDFMTDYVNNYVGGGDLTEYFGEEAVRVNSGKLAMGHRMYNGIIGMLQTMVEKLNGVTGKLPVGAGGDVIADWGDKSVTVGAASGSCTENSSEYIFTYTGGNAQRYAKSWCSGIQIVGTDIEEVQGNTRVKYTIKVKYKDGSDPVYNYFYSTVATSTVPNNVISAGKGEDFTGLSTIQTGKEWQGQVAGVAQDATLSDIDNAILSGINAGTLEVTESVVDAQPVPTVAPTTAPTPVPTTAPAENALDGINSIINQNDDTLESINDLIGLGQNQLESLNDLLGQGTATNEALEDLKDLIGGYAETLEGINDLLEGEGGIAGTNNALDDIKDLLGGQAGVMDGINDLLGQAETTGDVVGEIADAITAGIEGVNEISSTIAEALSIPTAAEATQNASAIKFDLRTLFPFCIPFDVYRIANLFTASPITPSINIPFNVPALGFAYTFNLDLHDFDGVAAILRNVEYIAFCIGLAMATRKMIRW